MSDASHEPTVLPDVLKDAIANELVAGEQLVWVSQPQPQGKFPWLALFPMIFGLFFTCFALFWMGMAIFIGGQAGPAGLPMALFGVPFVLVGLGMMSTPFWMKRRLRRAAERTVYAITNQRAIIIDGGYLGDNALANLAGGLLRSMMRGTSVRSYTPDKLGQITRTQRDDGTGDVYFGAIRYTMDSDLHHAHQHIQRDGFFSVPHVKDVEDMVKSLAATQPPSSS